MTAEPEPGCCEAPGCTHTATRPEVGDESLCAEHERLLIREANDRFRTTFEGGTVLITAGVQALGQAEVTLVLERVRTHTDFTHDNDPYGEHDFGAFDHGGRRVYWKIDYYDQHLEVYHDPRLPSCRRVLTVLLASEY